MTITTFTLRSTIQRTTKVSNDLLSALINEYKGELILLDANQKQCFKYKTSPALRGSGEHPSPVQMNSCLTLLACDVMASRGMVSVRAEDTIYLLAENVSVNK